MDNFIKAKDIKIKNEECKNIYSIVVDSDTELDIFNIGSGAFSPLTGFMTSRDYHDVIEDMHLECGMPWTLPITLDVKKDTLPILLKKEKVCLKNKERKNLAILYIEDVFKIEPEKDITKIFGVYDRKHPGVEKELARNSYRVGGRLEVFLPDFKEEAIPSLLPEETKRIFKEKGWKTITGFQTRNPIHRAHEYLQRIALEITDGLFIHPLIGWKKEDDFSPEAVVETYKKMVELFYSEKKVILSFLKTTMRYAGPREAVFHAIIRKNFGCTHFIVGRDHAGVGNYYDKYAAHKLFDRFDNLGIEILRLHGPYYCKRCQQIVTENTCKHKEDAILHISGTVIRNMLKKGEFPLKEYMREEISRVLLKFYKKGRVFNENCKEKL